MAWDALSKVKHYETAFKLIRIGMNKVSPKDPQRQVSASVIPKGVMSEKELSQSQTTPSHVI